MNKPTFSRRTFLISTAATGLSSYVPPGIGGVGIGGTGRQVTSFGRIDAFGSIWVNGVEFFTNTAAITVNNASAAETALRLGMTVRVAGNVDTVYPTGDAITVDYIADLLGPVTAPITLSPTGAQFAVLGRVVATDVNTVYDGVFGPSALSVGQTVEVSGLMDSNTGAILATRIELKSGGGADLRSSGTVANLTATSFTLGTLTVNYSGGALVSPIGNGTAVRVRGTAGVTLNTINATRVELASDVSSAGDVELEGVAASVSATQFVLGSKTVLVSPATVWRNGLPSDLVNGVVVDIDASTNANGTLQASKVTFRPAEAVDMTATVFSRTATTLSMLGSDGIVVTANADTRVRDDSKKRVSNYSWNTIAVGDTLRVRGTQLTSRRDGVLARELRRQEPTSIVEIHTRVSDAHAPVFSLLDTPVTISANTLYKSTTGGSLTAAEFFARAAGSRITVRGTYDGQSLLALTIQL